MHTSNLHFQLGEKMMQSKNIHLKDTSLHTTNIGALRIINLKHIFSIFYIYIYQIGAECYTKDKQKCLYWEELNKFNRKITSSED